MKDSFSSFVLRDLIALLSGLMLMLLHGTVQQGILTALGAAVCCAMGAFQTCILAVGDLCGGWTGEPCAYPNFPGSPSLVLAPLGMIILCRGALTLGYGGRPYAAIWMAVLAAALAFGPDGRRLSYAWTALAVVLAGAYVLLALQPSLWRPFLLPGLAASVLFLAD